MVHQATKEGCTSGHSWWGTLLHHLHAALMVGAIVGILHSVGALGWLDAIMLSAAGSAQSPRSAQATPPADLPLVVAISPDLYEREFGQSSPMNRSKLAKLLSSIPAGDGGAKLVAIDLDLSPINGDTPTQEAQAELDAVLKRMADAGTTVVLALPLRVATPELLQLKFGWMQSMCAYKQKAPIAFALTRTTSHFGQVVQYSRNSPSLGIAAAHPESTRFICDRLLSPLEAPAADNLMRALLATSFDDSAITNTQHSPLLHPFNANFFVNGDSHIVVANDLDKPKVEVTADKAGWAGRTVFVGGAFDERDFFMMPMESGGSHKVEGVVVHAATYYSETHPIGSVPPFLSLAIDILLGTVMAFLFEATLRPLASANATAAHPWRRYVFSRVVVGLNIVLVAALVLAFLWLAYRVAYPRNLWVNPGPILIGVFVKFLIASAQGRHHHKISLPAWSETAVLVVAAIAFIARSDH